MIGGYPRRVYAWHGTPLASKVSMVSFLRSFWRGHLQRRCWGRPGPIECHQTWQAGKSLHRVGLLIGQSSIQNIKENCLLLVKVLGFQSLFTTCGGCSSENRPGQGGRCSTMFYNNWLVVWKMFYFSIYWEFQHPNWRTHIFQRGRGRGPSTQIGGPIQHIREVQTLELVRPMGAQSTVQLPLGAEGLVVVFRMRRMTKH